MIERVPPPTGDPERHAAGDGVRLGYDEYRGAVTYVRVMNGTVRRGSGSSSCKPARRTR